jgi:hypothetical protein
MNNGFGRFHQPLLRALIAWSEGAIAESYLAAIKDYPLKPEEQAALGRLIGTL